MVDLLKLCEQAARAGGRSLQDWVGRIQAREKGPADLVTEADLASQEAISAVLMAECPEFGLVGEESAALRPDAEFCWIVDPLDGTTNYVHQVAHYAVSIALAQRGRPIAGVVYDPAHDEMFSAALGQGARLNGRPLRTSRAAHLGESLVAASFSAQVPVDSPEIDQFVAILLASRAVRRTGSAALNLAYVAAGRFDAFWARTTKAWDVAAGVLLVEEAGGVVSELDGSNFDLREPHPVAAANATLHGAFRAALVAARRR